MPINNCSCHNQGWYGQSPELDSGSFHLDWPDPLSLGYHTGRPLRFELHSESDLSLHVSAQSFTLNQPACCIVVSGRPKQGFNSHTAMVQIPSHKVLVVHDDLDLPTGKVRLRAKGGHGGHNGMRSITQHLKGSQDFPRLKIGIGRPAGQLPVASFVLQVGPFLTDLPIQVHTVSVAVASLAGLMYFLFMLLYR